MKTMNRMVTKLTQTSPHVGFPTSKLKENYEAKVSEKEKREKRKGLCLSATAILWGLAENPERGGLEIDLGGW
jgi:hypothetical protein